MLQQLWQRLCLPPSHVAPAERMSKRTRQAAQISWHAGAARERAKEETRETTGQSRLRV